MCGLAFTSFPVGSALGETMRHRGPDGYGFHRTPLGELHHSRLAINGDQPQPIARRGTLTVYNGELYGELQARGGDAQLMAELFAATDGECLQHFNGTWALLQVRENHVVAVRDRFGLRPLFRYFDGERLVYASNVHTIAAALGAVGVTLEPSGGYPARGRVPLPCFYRNVEPLWPGVIETATFTPDGRVARIAQRRWYRPRAHSHGQLEHLLADAIRIRLHPRGALCVSGGVDSYLLHAYAPVVVPRYHLDVTGEADAARALGATLLEPPTLAREDIDDVLEQPYYAEPPNQFLAAALRAHDPELRVVLTGLGADELFGGYRHHARPCTPAAVEEVYELRDVRSGSWRDVELDYVIPHHYGYRTDQAFLRYGLEARHPFMDHRVVETALTQPTDGKAALGRLAIDLGWEPQAKRGFAADLGRYVTFRTHVPRRA